MLNRRNLLAGIGLAAAGGTVTSPVQAVNTDAPFANARIRGAINAEEFGIHPGALDDQSKAFAQMLQSASDRDAPVFLAPGMYVVSNINLPRRVRLTGVPGATRLVYGGDGHLLLAERGGHVELTGLVIDGANRWLGDSVQGLFHGRDLRHLVIDNCEIIGSGKNAVALEACSGRIERSVLSGAADAAIYSVQANQMEIRGNRISDCGNGGILVHRWQAARDGTIVTGNRIERIGARNGGTGQFGNGINVFRAGDVIVSNNNISACAFSAVRSNGGNNIQIVGNNCSDAGETAIYSEFIFEGAVIGNNIIDGAANGISLVNFDKGGRMAVCSGNLVRNLRSKGPYPADAPGFGVGISVEADSSVTGNVIEGAPLYGINIGWGKFMRNVVATGNVIRDAGVGIAVSVVKGTGSAVISDNVIAGAKRGGIVGHEWVKPVTGDLANGAGHRHRLLTIERNQVVG